MKERKGKSKKDEALVAEKETKDTSTQEQKGYSKPKIERVFESAKLTSWEDLYTCCKTNTLDALKLFAKIEGVKDPTLSYGSVQLEVGIQGKDKPITLAFTMLDGTGYLYEPHKRSWVPITAEIIRSTVMYLLLT